MKAHHQKQENKQEKPSMEIMLGGILQRTEIKVYILRNTLDSGPRVKGRLGYNTVWKKI